ncbi:MAG TPA: DUF1398 domain-containing protein [Verrucomicrobia bacterium]|nr:DUF1398 domain-containing protein [Verrucomicrobiota bacterium]HOP96458.1 DUF1398 domain-containing protein [Verrucomicrobiota bacterium]
MNTEIITEVAHETQSGNMTFPEAIGKLMAAGVEYYHVDYMTLRKTCYRPYGEAATLPIKFRDLPRVAAVLSVTGLKAAIADSQEHGQHYRDFSRRAMEAGVQGYFAFLRGRRVVYLGRTGDLHVEWFPDT